MTPLLAATIPLDILERLVELASDQEDEAVRVVRQEIEEQKRLAGKDR